MSKNKELKYFEVRWYNKATGQYLGESRVDPRYYDNDFEKFKLEVEEGLKDREDNLDVRYMEVYTDGTSSK